jgi:hypothetical protein
MPALTQCWYTRVHVPAGRKHKEADGSSSSECKYCHKAITSWGKGGWYLADGFNVSRLRESTGGRYLYLIDVADELVVARFPIDHLTDAAAIRAYRDELAEAHGVNQPGSTLQLRDSNQGARLH